MQLLQNAMKLVSFAFFHSALINNRHYPPISPLHKFSMQLSPIPDQEQTLASFLQDHCAKYFKSPKQLCHIFIGNEAADADSILSALCYSYFCYRECSSLEYENYYIPLVSVPSVEIQFRREVRIMLQAAHINILDLHSISDFSFDLPKSLTVSLLDHNSMNKALRQKLHTANNYEIVEIIDHHLDAGDHSHVKGLNRRIAFEGCFPLVGSCCTLVFEKGRMLFTPQTFPRDVAHILLGVILIDTLNMDEKANKGTARDGRAIEELMTILQMSNHAKNAYYDSLMNCKMDPSFWGELSCDNCLNFDFKQFDWNDGSVGFSSILLPVTELMNKSNSLDSIQAFMVKSHLNFLIIMSLCNATTIPQRELLIVSDNSLITNTIADKLCTDETIPLELTKMELAEEVANQCDKKSIHLIAFKQGNLKASRKQLAPLICSYSL
jgi:exopolyphosphatase